MLWLLACVAPVGVLPMNAGEGFFDRPFPSDTRLVDGHPDFSGFPGEGSMDLLDHYLGLAPVLDGFGTNSPIFVRFEEAIDTSLLPTAETSRGPRSTVMLVNVDANSPFQGERIPLVFRWTDHDRSYEPANLLSIAPLPGFPLHAGTTYALILRAPLARAGAQVLDWGHDHSLDHVAATLRSLEMDPEEASLVVQFTTQKPTREMADISAYIHDQIGLPVWDQELELMEEHSSYRVFRGKVTVPIWQHGARPYHTDGGDFVFNEDGTPDIYAWENIYFGLTVPNAPMPDAGWPIVIYGHGTGGDYLTHARSPSDEGVVMAHHGVAMIGISQPLHADRGTPDTNVELDSFNYLNPIAGRCNFRQGALDHIFLAHLIQNMPPRLSYQGDLIRFDASEMGYFGHSQGGLTGAIATPFMTQNLRASGFSGAGGVLALTLMLRKDPLDIQQLIEDLLAFSDDETADAFHPVVGIVQTLVEATDPINYAPGWFAEDLGVGGRPMSILLTEGLLDDETPSVTAEALASAGHLSIVGTPANDPQALRLRQLSPEATPIAENAEGWDETPITAGLSQYPNDGHFAIYDNRAAQETYQVFLSSALSGTAILP